jgi:hypothetical protein
MSKPELARFYSETGQSEGHGRGYVIPTRGDPKKGLPVFGVTSISGRYSAGIGNEDGLAQYAADVTLRWANENWTQLAGKSDQDAYRGGRFRWKDHTNHLAQVGTDSHEWIEVDLKDGWGHPDMWGEALEVVDEWVALKQQHDFQPLLVEATVFNPEFEYAGTLDFGGYIDGVLTLADVKTGRNLWESNRLQMAAMAKCPIVMVKDAEGVWHEEEAPKWERFAFVHLRPNYYNPVTGITEKAYGEIQYMDPDEIDDLFEIFKGLLAGKQAENRLKARRKGKSDE